MCLYMLPNKGHFEIRLQNLLSVLNIGNSSLLRNVRNQLGHTVINFVLIL
jgi:hypothetical protein